RRSAAGWRARIGWLAAKHQHLQQAWRWRGWLIGWLIWLIGRLAIGIAAARRHRLLPPLLRPGAALRERTALRGAHHADAHLADLHHLSRVIGHCRLLTAFRITHR